jgi:hypothetical protein
MVFLGGAVLANIVSNGKKSARCIYSLCTDGRQGRYVDIKAGVARARLTCIGEAGRKIMLVCNMRITWISVTIDHWQTKAWLAVVLQSRFASLSQAVSLSVGSVAQSYRLMSISQIQPYTNGPHIVLYSTFSEHVLWQRFICSPATREIDVCSATLSL